MTIGRFVWVFALPLAVTLVASTAHGAPLKVDSPNMAMSIRDWHPELAAASPRRRVAANHGHDSRARRQADHADRDQPEPGRAALESGQAFRETVRARERGTAQLVTTVVG